MIENKKIEQDLKEIDIRINDLKVNIFFDFGKSAVSLMSSSAIFSFSQVADFSLTYLLITVAVLNIIYNIPTITYSIIDKNKQIKNLKYLKDYLQLYDLSKISIDKLENKITSMKKNDINKSNLEFLKHYLENNSLSEDDMKYKKLASKSKK